MVISLRREKSRAREMLGVRFWIKVVWDGLSRDGCVSQVLNKEKRFAWDNLAEEQSRHGKGQV